MFQPGDIVIAAFPFSSLTGLKRRPCVVLAAADTPHDFLVAFVTTTLPAAQLPSATLLSSAHPAWRQTGLKTASVIRVDKLVTLNDCVISGVIGLLPPDVLATMRGKLKTLLQIS
ncbi:MAG TPA: type II toxin-antitoxin system PemK/MazF family toxin [Verrucomicrobiae bacterium]|nr:type II toxin-antitoxin system PemK/MazF family toxin [Verrucomicrobiae bacterium]